MNTSRTSPSSSAHPQGKATLMALSLAALGVVYGDIGTSPLYAFKEAFAGAHGLPPTHESVWAALSMLFWAVMLIVSLKYVAIVLRFDNEGEGGVLALTALAHRLTRQKGRWGIWVIATGIFAAALFYGDAIITPAISVLSAVEGISVVTPDFQAYVVPITLGILTGLFFIQRHGTHRVGGLFGPVTVLWFVTLGLLGLHSILQTPTVLYALNPAYALEFASTRPAAAFLLLSAVFLALTGGEALYADMGHFGTRPIRLAWYGLVCPSLMLNYFGQGALVMREPEAIANPFYLLAPDGMLVPLVILATAATVIASQATITGAYSMTLQASRLGYLPRIRILHTSDTEQGQIYIPSVNWLMLGAVLWLVLEFRSSGALAAAYGIAVSGTMIITTLLTFIVMLMLGSRRRWLLGLMGLFFALEVLFFSANLTKIADGGWLPIVLEFGLFVLLTTWKEGSSRIAAQRRQMDIAMNDFIAMPTSDIPRVEGTAVYLTSDPNTVLTALFHNLKHFKVMHERTIFLNVINEDIPYVPTTQRLHLTTHSPTLQSLSVRFGFREEPNVPLALSTQAPALNLDPMNTTYFVARSTVVDGPGELPTWRAALFGWMMRQSESAASYYQLPPNRVVELGTQVLL